MQLSRYYIAIDLKSFYASAECADRKLDPLTTNLVVADQSRTDKTIQPVARSSRWRQMQNATINFPLGERRF